MPVRPPTEQELTDPAEACDYAADVLHGRFPAGEQAVLKDAYYAAFYAIYVLERRWPEAEPIIARDSNAAWRYTRDVIKGRWLPGEKVIMSSKYHAEWYTDMLKKRDPEGYAEFQLEHGDWSPSKVAETALTLARRI